jgi:hypothetical protein
MHMKATRSFLVALTCQAITIFIASFGGRRSNGWDVFRVVVFWAIFFAVLTGIVVAIIDRLTSNQSRRSRAAWVLVALVLAVASYYLVLVFTGGYILNAQYPLFLVFLSGSLPAFADTFWPRKLLAATVSLLLVLAVGFGAASLFWLTKRRAPMRITIVKFMPAAKSDLRISWQPEAEPDQFERERLQELGLYGEARVTNVYDYESVPGRRSHTLIVLSHPLSGEVYLREAKTDVVYLQQETN